MNQQTTYQIVWKPIAETDLCNIVDYIAKNDPIKAKKFANELRTKVLPLAQFPKLGKTGRPSLPKFLRELVVYRNYIIFYRILDNSNVVEILRVKHAAQMAL